MNSENQEVKLAMIALGKVPFFILGIAIMGIITMMLGGIYLYYKKKDKEYIVLATELSRYLSVLGIGVAAMSYGIRLTVDDAIIYIYVMALITLFIIGSFVIEGTWEY